ncbi:MAG: hypothetical protein P1U34_08075 [Coxiellaceae bacterium]|nr:hypothetical protein [Coxiellaceae bacterium]
MNKITMALLCALLPALSIAKQTLYNCACIGWSEDHKYYDCRDIKNTKTNYKRGTHMAKLTYKQVENWVQKDRLAKYIYKGPVYEPTTGWYCQEIKNDKK